MPFIAIILITVDFAEINYSSEIGITTMMWYNLRFFSLLHYDVSDLRVDPISSNQSTSLYLLSIRELDLD